MEKCYGTKKAIAKSERVIKSKVRVLKYGEVFMLVHIVRQMYDMLKAQNKEGLLDIFKNMRFGSQKGAK